MSIGRLAGRHGALIALVAVAVFGALRYPAFPTAENLLNVIRQQSMISLVALGMTFVILTGGIDLSVGSILAASGLAAAIGSRQGSILAIAGGVAMGLSLGLLNGIAIAKGRLQPFVVTLASMIAIRGAVLGLTGESSIRVAPDAMALTATGRGLLGPIPIPGVILIGMYLLGWLFLRYTSFGRHLFAVGDDSDGAWLLGLKVDRIVIGAYALSGGLAGLAGVMLAARLGAAQPVAATGWELDAIAAVVVGGTLLTGGQGGVGRTAIGALFLALVLNLLNLEGTISPWWQWVIRGVILLAVVMIDRSTRSAPTHV